MEFEDQWVQQKFQSKYQAKILEYEASSDDILEKM